MYKAKKSLGQNFLKSGAALSAIVTAGNIAPEDIILEIGPGKGALTEYLLKTGAKVVALEKDTELIGLLQEKFKAEIETGKLDLLEADVLEFNPDDLKKYQRKYKIIANIPYYITGAIIRKFLEADNQPEQMVLLVQKEVSDRIVARDGKESILSISVKAYAEPKYIKKVSKKEFSPAPKVDSAVISIANISKKNFKNISEARFFEILKAGFAHKRKKLLRNLELIEKNKEKLNKIFIQNKISTDIRPEELNCEAWLHLAQELS